MTAVHDSSKKTHKKIRIDEKKVLFESLLEEIN
jgi:hypothetical protein